MRRLMLLLFLGLFLAPVANASSMFCYWETVVLPYEVCTQWWDGTRTCHIQYGEFDVYSCTVMGGGGPLPPGDGGGGGLPPDPPPSVEIVGISDENPQQPTMYLQVNEWVVETTVSYDGNVVLTTGRTGSVFLQPLNVLGPETTVTIQCRNADHVYATAVTRIHRSFDDYHASGNVWLNWVEPGEDPELLMAEYERTVDLGLYETFYDVPTVGSRNGRFEHIMVEDHLVLTASDVPLVSPAWETKYTIDNPQMLNVYYGWSCDLSSFTSSVCTDVDAFVRDGSTRGTAAILDFDLPFHAPFGVNFLSGREVVVGP